MKDFIAKTKSLFFNLRISNKIISVAAISSLITLTILCSISFYRERNSYVQRKITELETLARILSSNTVASLRFDDPFTANEYVQSLQHDPAIESVSIYNNKGDLFSHYSRDLTASAYPAPDFQGQQWQGDSLYYARPIALNGVEIGSLLLKSNTSALKSAIRESLLIGFVLVLGGLAITIALVRRMQGTITNPIKQLATLSESISREKDYNQRLEKLGEDEIGTLIDSFNHMLETIQQQDKALRKINLSLGRIVEERTLNLRLKNDELREASEATQVASNAKSDFLATISHELRTPMTAIVGLSELLLNSGISDEHQRSIKVIADSSDVLLKLIDDLLDFSAIESGKIDLKDAPFDLLQALEDTLEINISRATKANITYILNCSKDLPQRIVCDITRLKQIMLNLLSNAQKFTESGQIILDASVEKESLCISVQDTGIGIPQDKVQLLFDQFTQADNSSTRKYGGVGLGLAITKRLVTAMGGTIDVFSKEHKGSVFTVKIPLKLESDNHTTVAIGNLDEHVKSSISSISFLNLEASLEDSLKSLFSNWGLRFSSTDYNLLIASAIANSETDACDLAARGKVASSGQNYIVICNKLHVAALRKDGHEHLITTPVLLTQTRKILSVLCDPAIGAQSPILRRSISTKPLKILLIEDHQATQDTLASLMEQEGHSIDVADNGEEGLKLLKAKSYDIIFMDIHMPVMDGIECTKRIRSDFPKESQPWIIAFTANAQKSAALELQEAKVDEILYKPVKLERLHESLENFHLNHSSTQSPDFSN
ncbi:ATP-binding protein [Puniceicoccaceae bacterium K14]|nr:ATP-binding protein [Puniceicoccaceae bacterium K14]